MNSNFKKYKGEHPKHTKLCVHFEIPCVYCGYFESILIKHKRLSFLDSLLYSITLSSYILKVTPNLAPLVPVFPPNSKLIPNLSVKK